MSEQINITAYTFDELSDAAKERARDWYREGGLDYEWWDYVYDNVKTAGDCLGITVDTIYFQLAYSQGDGACFVGSYEYRAGWRKALRKEFGGDMLRDLEAIGQRLQDAQKRVFYQMVAQCDTSPRGNQQIHGVERADGVWPPDDAEEGIRDALRDFAHWIYCALRDEYEWLNSDEQVDESIRSNEYLFNAAGSRCVTL